MIKLLPLGKCLMLSYMWHNDRCQLQVDSPYLVRLHEMYVVKHEIVLAMELLEVLL